MTTITREDPRAARALQVTVAVLAMLALTVGPGALAGAQEAPGGEEGTGVVCDAESFIEEWEDEGDEFEEFTVYVTTPGQTVTCQATGLDPAQDVSWNVDFYDFMDLDEEEIDDEADWPIHSSQGETLGADDHDGEIEFSFTVPDDIVFGALDGHVRQGPEDEASYHEEFFGFIEQEFHEGEMECEPDPVAQGRDVECVVEEMAPDEGFEWEVYFFSLRDFLDLFFGPDEDGDPQFGEEPTDDPDDEFLFAEPDADGEGETDEDGAGSFGFRVPTDREIDVYIAHAGQSDHDAFYIGRVVEEEQPPGGNGGGAPTGGSQNGGSPGAATGGQAVERPARIDAGGGGTAG